MRKKRRGVTPHVCKQYTREATKIIIIHKNLKTPPERRMSDYLKQPYKHTENEVRIVSTLKTAQSLQRRTCFFFISFKDALVIQNRIFLNFIIKKINKFNAQQHSYFMDISNI